MSENLDAKNFNFYANSAILIFGFVIILYLLKKNNSNVRDENSYDWNKYNYLSDTKFKNKKDGKDKSKIRVKDYSKGTGFVKDEHKFPVNQGENKRKDVPFLNCEEADNLQDMINYAASINQNEKHKNIYPIESLYSQVMNSNSYQSSQFTPNEKIDIMFSQILKNKELDDNTKIDSILEQFSKIIKLKNKNLSESSYIGIIELFMNNGLLSHASYFLCQMDRLKMKIPRSILEQFLDYSVTNKIFENKNEINIKNAANPTYNEHAYDKNELQSDPDYVYYFQRRNNYKQRNDMQAVFSSLKVDSKPFYPKNVEEEHLKKLKTKLSEIDPANVKEFIPKNYKIVKKEDQ